MDGVRTRGHPAALDAIRAMLGSYAPHALLLAGPPGVGKTTLALDFAAGLLCQASPLAARPCGACRGCRMVASGNHPDLHRVAPEGPGGQIRIGSRTNAEPGTIRRLTADLALLPVEGGARVGILERADRMNEDAQSALLKTLEEPPAGVTILLCADEEERLLPTVRSRCAHLRLGPVPVRDVEAILADRGGVEPPVAARLARLSGGRPGVALAWAGAPDAVAMRAEIARTLLDLLDAPRARRLTAVPELLVRSSELLAALDPPVGAVRARPAGRAGGETDERGAADATEEPGQETPTGRVPAVERRRAAITLLAIWRDLTRDLAVAGLGDLRSVRDGALLDDLRAAADRLAPGSAAAFLARLERSGELLEANLSPELAIDVLVLAWPRATAAA